MFLLLGNLPAAVFSAYGFGSRLLVELSVVMLCLQILVQSFHLERKAVLKCLVPFGLLLAGVLDAGVWRSSCLVALCLGCSGRWDVVVALLGAHLSPVLCYQIAPTCGGVLMSPYWALCTFVLMLFAQQILPDRLVGWLKTVTLLLYAASLVFWAYYSCHMDRCPGHNVPHGYRIGAALEKVIGRKLSADGEIYYDNVSQSSVVVTNCGTVYLDHDSHTRYDGGNYYQPSPWSWNELLAAEPFRVALAHDGALLLNKGSCIRRGEARPLWGQVLNGEFVMLGGTDGSRLVMGDADFVCNSLVPYQYHFIRRLSGCDWGYRAWMCLAAFVLSLCSVSRFRGLGPFLLLLATTTLPLAFPASYDRGGVRYVGSKVLYPHTSLGYGVARALQQASINSLFTQRDASILIVAARHRAHWMGEKLVVLEPEAQVDIGDVRITAADMPLGTVENVPDARQLVIAGGGEVHDAVCSVSGVTVYGTGSPAAIDFGRILR